MYTCNDMLPFERVQLCSKFQAYNYFIKIISRGKNSFNSYPSFCYVSDALKASSKSPSIWRVKGEKIVQKPRENMEQII